MVAQVLMEREARKANPEAVNRWISMWLFTSFIINFLEFVFMCVSWITFIDCLTRKNTAVWLANEKCTFLIFLNLSGANMKTKMVVLSGWKSQCNMGYFSCFLSWCQQKEIEILRNSENIRRIALNTVWYRILSLASYFLIKCADYFTEMILIFHFLSHILGTCFIHTTWLDDDGGHVFYWFICSCLLNKFFIHTIVTRLDASCGKFKN